MPEPKDYMGKRIKFLGHKLEVVKVIEEKFGYSKVSLSCAVHCCTTPCYMSMEMTLLDFENLCKFIELAEKMNRFIQTGTLL